MKSPKTIKRFWAKVDIQSEDGCWIWKGAKIPQGYGLFNVPQEEKGKFKQTYAHRVIWELCNGPIPKGLCVCHRCDVPACCNPDHLFLGSQTDNLKDAKNKNRTKPWGLKDHKGEKNHAAKLTEKNILAIRKLGPLFTQDQLAQNFGVCRNTIGRILRGEKWKHV